MSKISKYGIGAGIILVFCVALFFAGRISAPSGTEVLESRITELNDLLVVEANRNRRLIAGLSDAQERVGELEITVDRLTDSNNYLAGRLSDISSGLSGDIETVSSLIGRLDYYIEKAEEN